MSTRICMEIGVKYHKCRGEKICAEFVDLFIAEIYQWMF